MPGSRVDDRWRSTLTTSWPLSRRSRPTHLPSRPSPPVISTRMNIPFSIVSVEGANISSLAILGTCSPRGSRACTHCPSPVRALRRAGWAQVPAAVLLIHEVPSGKLDAVAERLDDLGGPMARRIALHRPDRLTLLPPPLAPLEQPTLEVNPGEDPTLGVVVAVPHRKSEKQLTWLQQILLREQLLRFG